MPTADRSGLEGRAWAGAQDESYVRRLCLPGHARSLAGSNAHLAVFFSSPPVNVSCHASNPASHARGCVYASGTVRVRGRALRGWHTLRSSERVHLALPVTVSPPCSRSAGRGVSVRMRGGPETATCCKPFEQAHPAPAYAAPRAPPAHRYPGFGISATCLWPSTWRAMPWLLHPASDR